VERICEQIRVAVVFVPGRKIKPVWFEWRKRKHTISKTTYTWSDKVGEETRLHFAVSDGEALFELIYLVQTQSWNLLQMEPEGCAA